MPPSADPVTGVPGPPDDAELLFSAYVPLVDASGAAVPLPSCATQQVHNVVNGSGSWTPLDVRDLPASTVTNSALNDITAKCLAIQKTVDNVTHPGGPNIPGDVLKYTLNFQGSDAYTFGNLVVRDRVADGQSILAAPLRRSCARGSVPASTAGPIPPADRPEANYAGLSCAGVKGGRQITFKVSDAMHVMAGPPRHVKRVLTGGWAAGPLNSPVPATGTITFYTRIDDAFTHPHPGDKWVDKLDPICNFVSISGRRYANYPAASLALPVLASPPAGASDTSGTLLTISGGTFTKSIYAKNGSTSGDLSAFTANPDITYELKYDPLPSSDAENFSVRDWLPRPVLTATAPLIADGLCGVNPPLTGHWCFIGPGVGSAPSSTNAPTPNTETFTFGSFHDTTNSSGSIVVRYTLTTNSSPPFADALLLTNVAQGVRGQHDHVRELRDEKVTCARRRSRSSKWQEPDLRVPQGASTTRTIRTRSSLRRPSRFRTW